MTPNRERPPGPAHPDTLVGVRVVTFDFGNTLVPVDRAGLRRVVEITGSWVVEHLGAPDIETFLATWAEERERQFREEIPRYREADLAARFVRVLARLRGMPGPSPDVPWDDDAAARYSQPDEVALAVDTYSRAFVDALPASPEIGPLLARLAGHYTLGILSNWPFAATIDRYAEAAGWTPYLRAIVVSQRVGTIKPHPAIFAAALAALGGPDPATCLHVGDDWAADVVGAKRAGWRAAHVRTRPEDSPLPGSEPDDTVVADLELDAVTALEPALAAIAEPSTAG